MPAVTALSTDEEQRPVAADSDLPNDGQSFTLRGWLDGKAWEACRSEIPDPGRVRAAAA